MFDKFIHNNHLSMSSVLISISGYVFRHCANICWNDRLFGFEEIHSASDKEDLSLHQHSICKLKAEPLHT